MAIMTDWGLLTDEGHHWLISDGEFPFDACDDRCTSDRARQRNRADWARRKANRAETERQAAACNMTLSQWYADRSGGW